MRKHFSVFKLYMPEWRNWQTHTTQNRAGNHAGSSPASGTNNVSVWINRADRCKYYSEKDDIFYFDRTVIYYDNEQETLIMLNTLFAINTKVERRIEFDHIKKNYL